MNITKIKFSDIFPFFKSKKNKALSPERKCDINCLFCGKIITFPYIDRAAYFSRSIWCQDCDVKYSVKKNKIGPNKFEIFGFQLSIKGNHIVFLENNETARWCIADNLMYYDFPLTFSQVLEKKWPISELHKKVELFITYS